MKRLALLFPVLLVGTLLSTGNPAGSPDRRAIAEEFVRRLLRGDYAVGSSIKSASENEAGFRRSIQGVLNVVGRPVEITSSTDSPQREGWVIVEMRCQNESLTLGVRVDDAGSVGNLEVSMTPKPITSAAVLLLVEQGRLDLDARVF